MKKLTATILVLALTLTLLSGCFVKEQDFTKGDFTVTLTSAFKEETAAAGHFASWTSKNSSVIVIREGFDLFALAELPTDMPLKDYAQLTVDVSPHESPVEEKDGLVSFTFTTEVSGRDLTYFATVHRGSEAYWLVQIACYAEDFDKYKDDFIKWSKSVKV
jgi:hypothetical protein